ncbi:hypothetical protein [Methylomonas sp. 11b]|uniref:hypothetical protein n=1 Tax=Methylomonas sp. 11b TaxID=1168169 RepID=UPI0004B31BCB|nr:hypothetical protein [Methylomonas sp. 11b]
MRRRFDWVDVLTVLVAALLLIGGALGLLCVASGMGIKFVGKQLLDALLDSMKKPS